jgi:D-inositol-3-phosphate glycosyltransferase
MYNLTTTCRFGGVETFVWSVSRELAKQGNAVHIIGGKGKIQRDIPGVRISLFPFWPRERIPNLGTRFQKLGERWSMGLLAFWPMLKERYDILHIHKPFDLPLGWGVKKRVGSKLVFGSHGTDFFPGDRIFAQAADRIVSCSEFNARQIQGRYGIRPEVIYNGIDPEVFRPLPADRELGQRFAIKPGDKVLVFAGRLIGLKGVGNLLRAVAHLDKEYSWRLILMGEGRARPDLEKLVRELGIQARVIFCGYIPNHELPRYYSIADLAVFPSLADETFGVAVCEAMACGRAVISTRVGGIPELVKDGESGILVEPRNWQDLAHSISQVLRDDQQRSRLGGSALERVRQHFTWEKVADRLRKTYEAALSTEKRSDAVKGIPSSGSSW